MNEKTHFLTSLAAVQIYNALRPGAYTEREAGWIADASQQTDHMQDVEFVNVSCGRDNPHRLDVLAVNDIPHHSTFGTSHTAFNHFIDIRKGPGIFDDYDGYSYQRGSAGKGEYQSFSDLVRDPRRLLAGNRKVDEAVNWWLGDEYVHAPGQPWYRNCSPALPRYSFPRDRGTYSSRTAELLARFPLADAAGRPGRGIPYSVFMPVDNLARYWFGRYVKNRTAPACLGPVLHAVQDASIPQHAAGTLGNWHGEYEDLLEQTAPRFCRNQSFRKQVSGLLAAWNRTDSRPPRARLRLSDRSRVPACNWEIGQLVTWVALHAYHAYAHTYAHFRRGFAGDPACLRRLYVLAVAMSAQILRAAGAVRKRF